MGRGRLRGSSRRLETGNFFPPTAQHGLREAITAAKNIEAAIAGRPLKPFVFTTLGQLATIGRRTGVAMVFGFKFSGLIAWGMWRSIYLMKLPRLAKKLRVMMDWTLDLLFGREIEQMITLRDVQALSDRLARIRAQTKGGGSAVGEAAGFPREANSVPSATNIRAG